MGKSTGKKIAGLVGFAFGFIAPEAFGFAGSAVWSGGLYGASLASTIWSATHKQKTSSDYKFDAAQNTIDTNAMIPIIYGTRKWSGGLLTWQSTYNDGENQRKDIVLCEGEISGISGVTANCQIITESPAFYISNVVYNDATIQIYKTDSPTDDDKRLVLYANGLTTNIPLQSSEDINSDNSNDYSCNLQKLLQYIEKLGNGWRVTNNAGVDGNPEPEDVRDVALQNCYNNPVGVPVAGIDNCSYEAYLGSSTQSPPSNYESVGGYKNCAYIRATLKVGDDLVGQSPNISAIIAGRKVYDTRTGVTAYSENLAMCLRDYILCKRFGMGRWITEDMIDEDSFKEVADHCDGLVTYIDAYGMTVTEPRYRLNIIIAEQRKHIENIQEILAVFGGFFVTSGDKISLRIEKQDAISYAFNESNIKEKSVKYDTSDLSDTPNRYIITYYDPAQNWTGVKVFVEDTADQHQRGQVIPKEITLNGCTSQGQALRLGRLYKVINRLSGITITFTTGTMAMHLQPGDIISFSLGVVSGKPLRILEISESKGEWTIKGQEYNSSIYDDRLGAQMSVGNYVSVPNAFTGAVPYISALTLTEDTWTNKDGTVVTNINCSWNGVSYQFLKSYVISLSTDNVNWQTIGNSLSTSYTIPNVQVGKSYFVKVQTQSAIGRLSRETVEGIYVTGKDEYPPDVISLLVEKTSQGSYRFTFSIAEMPDDLAGYRFKYNVGRNTFWDNATNLTSNLITSSPYETQAFKSGTYTVMIKAVDNSGNESENAEYAVIGLGDQLTDNVLFEDDMSDFIGSKTNCYIDADKTLVGNSTAQMWTSDSDPFWTNDSDPMWKDIYNDLTYEDTFTPDLGGMVSFSFDIQGNYAIWYRKKFPFAFWTSDNDKMWTNDNDAMWREGPWVQYLGKVETTAQQHEVKVIVNGGTVRPEIKKFTAIVDVPDKTETFSDLIIPASGMRLSLKNTYIKITNIYITLQDNQDYTAVDAKWIDKNTIGPLIRAFDSNRNTTKALVDIMVQGY